MERRPTNRRAVRFESDGERFCRQFEPMSARNDFGHRGRLELIDCSGRLVSSDARRRAAARRIRWELAGLFVAVVALVANHLPK